MRQEIQYQRSQQVMPPTVAAILFAAGILGLFWLDRDTRTRCSVALWIPLAWLSLAGSRSVSQWLQFGSPIDAAEQALEGNPVDRVVYTGLLLMGLAVLFNRRKQAARLLRANGPILFFFLYCAVSLLWSDFPGVAFKRWTKALGDWVMILIVLSDRAPATAVKRLLARASFLLIPPSVLLIKYFSELGRGYSRWEGTAYYTGVTTNKNTLGAICLFLGLASLWRFLDTYRSRDKTGRARTLTAHGVIVAMVLWLLWMANSMTSTSCFLLAGALLVVTSLGRVQRPAVVYTLLAAVILIPFSTLFLGVGASFAQGALGRNVSTLTDRTEVWKLVLSLTTNPWLGTGFESFWLGPRLGRIWSVFAWGPEEAHNGYIEIFLNLGWAGLTLLAVVLATGYRTVVTAYRRPIVLGSLGLAYFAVGIVYNFTEAAFFRMMSPAWIFFLLAITKFPAPATSKGQLPAQRSSPGRSWQDELPARGTIGT